MLTATSRAPPRPSPSPPPPATPRTTASVPCGQARQRRTAQRVEGPAAALALVAPQTPRHTARNRPLARAVRTAPSLVHTKLDRCLRCLAFPARQYRERLAPLRACQPARRRKPHLGSIIQPPAVPGSITNAYDSRIEPLILRHGGIKWDKWDSAGQGHARPKGRARGRVYLGRMPASHSVLRAQLARTRPHTSPAAA